MQNKMRFQFCDDIQHEEHAMAQFIQQTNIIWVDRVLLPFAILMLKLVQKLYCYSVRRIYSFRSKNLEQNDIVE